MRAMLHRSIVVALGLFCITAASAQSYSLRMGDKAYKELAYSEAIVRYEEAVKMGADTGTFIVRLAESYLNVRDFANAAKWYKYATATRVARPIDLYNYAQCLRATGQLEEADKWMSAYEKKAADDSRPARQIGAVNYATELLAKPVDGVTMKNVAANCEKGDMGAAFLRDRLVFASARKPQSAERRRHNWNGDPYLDLYSGTFGPDGELSDVQLMPDLNTRYHESNAAFTPDGREIWFTRNNFSGGKKGKTPAGVVNLKIYARALRDGHWVDERSFPYNSDAYSTGHAALSHDGNTMYFTSDMPGGLGGTDIWKCERTKGGEWGRPVNVGAPVNTEGDEMFPFVRSDDVLYFSSDGQAGLGGLDIFYSEPGTPTFGTVTNVGTPFNSRNDDFGFMLDSTARKGYLTSDRSGGMGDDDLYSFKLEKPMLPAMKLRGILRDKVTGEPLAGIKMFLKDEKGNKVGEVTTGMNGEYAFDLGDGMKYEIVSEDGVYRSTGTQLATGARKDTVIVQDLAAARLGDLRMMLLVSDSKTGLPLQDVEVHITEMRGQGNSVLEGQTPATGDMATELKAVTLGDSLFYRVQLNKQGYFPKDERLRYRITDFNQVLLHKLMDCTMEVIDVGEDIAKKIDIEPIYFDLDKWNIRQDASVELDKVVAVMKDNPTMEIELGSHTDSRGSDAYNLALSDRRAKSSAAYIVSRGISAKRIKGKGFGEQELKNNCTDGVSCPEAEHQMNRRTEFIITKM
jgi:outer membrane protein OmpA-like peptidoglycan-associated protein